MSENDNAEANASETTESEETEKETTDSTDWKALARKWEERAKANRSEADELKEEVKRIPELEAQLEEANTKVADAEKATESSTVELTRYKVAAKHGVTDSEDIELFLTGTDEETLTKQAQRISQHSARAPKPDAAQGNRDGKGATTPAEEFAEAWDAALKS